MVGDRKEKRGGRRKNVAAMKLLKDAWVKERKMRMQKGIVSFIK